MELSVIISTYNPDLNRLDQTLAAMQRQTLDIKLWELLIIDNNSSNRFIDLTDISFQPNTSILHEPRQGLTYARLKGFAAVKGSIIVMVDDDNILAPGYLQSVLNIFRINPKLGAAGGKSLPLFEVEPPVWLPEFYSNLALRNLGEQVIFKDWQHEYPASAPIGAGMAIRKEALRSYLDKAASGQNLISDRTGNSLTSGGDNDIVLEVLKSGWQVGYFPELVLQHIIPAQRMRVHYLARLVNNTNRSWVQLLNRHGISQWQQLSGLGAAIRKIKAYFTYKAWKNKVAYIKWQGACGMYDGLVK